MAGISTMFFSSGATGVPASQGSFGRHKYIYMTCCIHLKGNWGTGVHRPHLFKLKIINSIWCIKLSIAPINNDGYSNITHVRLLDFSLYWYFSHFITSYLFLCITWGKISEQRFPFQYVNWSLNSTLPNSFFFFFFYWFCDLFIYGGVWGFLMRTQDGIMYPHLFKNPQRVQNMRDELFSDVRTFLEVRCGAGEWLSSMWDSWQFLLLSEEEPEIRELFDRPRLPMINLYHFRWWPDL